MKLKAQQGTPPDPRVAAAQIRAQTDMAKVQAQNQGDMQELQQRAMIAQQNAELKLQELAMEREIEMLKMANNNLTLNKLKRNSQRLQCVKEARRNCLQQSRI